MDAIRTLSISLPVEILDKLTVRAEKQGRSLDEVVWEALRRYESVESLRELQAYGNKRALELGIKEEDVDRMLHEHRAERLALFEASGAREPIAS